MCTTVFWHFFVWNFLAILIHFNLATQLLTPPCNTTSLHSQLPNISGCTVLNYMYTTSTSLYVGSALWHTIRFYTVAVILKQLLTSSSLNSWALSYRSVLVKYFIILGVFSFIWLLYLSGINYLDGFILSEFGTARPCCCRLMTLYSFISLQ